MKTLRLWLVIVAGLLFGTTCMLLSQDYRFTTIAGTAGEAASVDGTNSDAHFSFPIGIGIDSSGNLYVGDASNNTIRKVTPIGTNWVVSTIAGFAGSLGSKDGTNSDARFYHPNGVAVDAAGNLFVVDHSNHTIRKIEPMGTNWVVTTIAGTAGVRGGADGTNGDAQFYSPSGITVDKQGNLYVADSMNFTIRKIAAQDTNWVVTTIAGRALNFGSADGTNDQAQFDAPYDLAADGDGNLFVADYNVNNSIRKIARIGPDWVVSTIAGISGTQGSANGTNETAQFHWPIGIAADAGGNLFVTDQFNNTIRQITPMGTNWVTTTVGGLALAKGSTDGVGADARFYQPWGIKVDGAGNLYVVDWHNSTIRKGVPGPVLGITISGNQVIVAWPSAATNYVLEASGDISPTATWTPMTNGIIDTGTSLVLTNDLTGAASFYRLRKQ